MRQMRVGVIGGGASGMAAAITAAERGAQVTLLESGERVGRKILSTGNGKCNLGNMNLSTEDYNGADSAWLRVCLGQFDTQEALQFFRRLGLMTKEKNGYLYPLAEQAAVVLDVLRLGLERNGVNVITSCKVQDIRANGIIFQNSPKNSARGAAPVGGCHEFYILAKDQTFLFDRVILACGSKAAPKTGSDGSGYKLAEKLGHKLVPVVPALVQLKCRETYLKEVAGVRAEAGLMIRMGKETIKEQGELQLTDYGISGIPVFQLSRKVNYILRTLTDQKHPDAPNKEAEVEISIDFLPEYSEQVWKSLFQERLDRVMNTHVKSRNTDDSGQTAEEFFTGILHKKLMFLFLKLAGIKRDEKVCGTDRRKLWRVMELCKDFRVHVTGSNSFEQAQVCAGGVDTAQVKTTMESKLVPGLYFAGELLDVDGRCGGYNLHWAWCSGYLAGKNAAGI